MGYERFEGINVGSGPHYADGWLNVDAMPTDTGKQPDMLVTIQEFCTTFPKGAFKKAYVGHVLEHIHWDELQATVNNIAYVADVVMVVGPCMDKAILSQQPSWLLDAIRAPYELDNHPWSHKWTPTEDLTAQAIREAGYDPRIVDVRKVRLPEWPNPSDAEWQTAMMFTTNRMDTSS